MAVSKLYFNFVRLVIVFVVLVGNVRFSRAMHSETQAMVSLDFYIHVIYLCMPNHYLQQCIYLNFLYKKKMRNLFLCIQVLIFLFLMYFNRAKLLPQAISAIQPFFSVDNRIKCPRNFACFCHQVGILFLTTLSVLQYDSSNEKTVNIT